MSRPDTWMPLYIGDYLADTMHLSGPEHGAYLLLLMHAWRNGPLPDNDRALAAIARTDAKAWKDMSETLRAFFTAGEGGLVQPRLERERVAAGQHADRRADAARRAAEARWSGNAPRNADGNAKRNPRSNAARMRDACATHAERIPPGMPDAMRDECPPPSPLPEEIPPSLPSEAQAPLAEAAKAEPASRGSRLPPDWKPNAELRAFAEEQGLDADGVAAQFADYWRSKPGAGGRKADWAATWRVWCRKEAEHSGSRQLRPGGGAPRPAAHEDRLAWMHDPGAAESLLQ